MLKKDVNEYALLNTDKNRFEDIYSVEDPWKLSSKQEQFRYKLTLNYIKKNFQKPGLKVLELGCSEGNFTEFLGKEGNKVTAVDISETAIERAKKKNIQNTEFISGDMIEYIVSHVIDKFDLILLMECIYYLSKENKIILLELLHKKMNPDAKVLVSFPVSRNNDMFISQKRILKKFSNRGFGLYKDINGIILSSKGKSGELLKYIPTYTLKKYYFSLHKIFFRSRINQKLFMFRKD
jgi:2-polyprenyl-3-methyl-5-hydroxy-6-metoxy-1,4-benzoquinol methylase